MCRRIHRAVYIGIAILVCLGPLAIIKPLRRYALGYLSWQIASYEWEKSAFESNPPLRKEQIDAQFHFASCSSKTNFSELFVSCFFHETDDAQILEAWPPLGKINTGEEHRYYTYRFLGIMPVDVVCNTNDEVTIIYPSFYH